MRFIYLMLLYFGSALFVSCDTTEPPPEEKPEPIVKSITLSADKFTCTEVWLSVSSENLVLPRNAGIYRGDSLVEQISLNKPDTLLYYDGLLPAKDYIFRMTIAEDTVESNTAAFRTLDTTSHNFTYQTWEFGDFNNSVLYDVAIINENNIWAVGEIYTTEDKYNAVHWNGSEWELKRILYVENGNTDWSPLHSILAFNESDIWFEGGIRWNGSEFISQPKNIYFPSYVNAMWGRSSSDLYIVGNSGNIAHYNGNEWQKIESGTDMHLVDVFGDTNGNVYAVGENLSVLSGIVLKNNTNSWSTLIKSEIIPESELFINKLHGALSGVWVDETDAVYTGGDLLYRYINGKWGYASSLSGNYYSANAYMKPFCYIAAIRGNASNDIFITGTCNTILHFNGHSWRQIGLDFNYSSSLLVANLAIRDNQVVAVGTDLVKAKLIMLKR